RLDLGLGEDRADFGLLFGAYIDAAGRLTGSTFRLRGLLGRAVGFLTGLPFRIAARTRAGLRVLIAGCGRACLAILIRPRSGASWRVRAAPAVGTGLPFLIATGCCSGLAVLASAAGGPCL